MSDQGWHSAESHSRSLPPSGSGGAGSGSGGAAVDEDDAAAHWDSDPFLVDEDALPGNETKTKDALIFLIDCSAGMQFPVDPADMQEMADAGRVKVKPEATGSWDSGDGGFDSSGAAAAAASGSGSGSGSGSASRGSGAAAAASSGASGVDPPCSHLQMVLKVLCHSVRLKIISNPDDYVGVCFFGARESKNGNNFPHIYVHTPLQQLSAAAIRRIDMLQDEAEFEATIGSLSDNDVARGKVEMDKILWICSSMFQEVQVSHAHKRIMLLTNNDTPYNPSDPLSRTRAVQKGRDLRDLDIATELIAVSKKPGADGRPKPFNPLLLFKDILIFDESEAMEHMRARTVHTHFADLRGEVMRKSMKKRALGSLRFTLGHGVDLGVKLFCMLKESRKDSAVFLDRETNEKLETQTRWLDTNTGSVLKEYEITRYYPYGGVKVELSTAESKALKELGEPGLVLMGFKPYSALKVHHNIKSPYFVYPDEEQVTDSNRAFKALLQAMIKTRTMAVVRLIYRRGTVPRFAALMPQAAKIDPDGGEVLQPPGFNMIFLPYADDIRNLKFEPTPIATDELIVDAKKIVEKLTVKSLPLITNPSLQHHYRVIQAIALQESEPAPIEDLLVPDEEGMAKHAPLISKFAHDAKELGEAAMAEMEPAVRKRKAAGDAADGPKRAKAADPDYGSIDWQQQLNNDTLKKLTVATLKVYCRQHKLPLAGAKAELLERVTDHLLQA